MVLVIVKFDRRLIATAYHFIRCDAGYEVAVVGDFVRRSKLLDFIRNFLMYLRRLSIRFRSTIELAYDCSRFIDTT